MNDMKRVEITGKAVGIYGDDIDTDRIIPARFLKCVTFDGLGEHAFEDDRLEKKQQGQAHPLDDPRYSDAELLFVNKNFGCGSSREHAPQAIKRWNKGIKAIVGESFAEIFFGNCVALGVPCVTIDETTAASLRQALEHNPDQEFTLDLASRQLRYSGTVVTVGIDDGPRSQFMEGRWDTTAELLEAREEIAATTAGLPYFDHWGRQA